MADFFVSYTSADKAWAEWIGFVLEEEGFTVVIQAWDFRPGSNFVLEMQRAATEADRTIMVLSPDYLKSQFASPEWAASFAQDPQGLKRKLVPVMVRQCQPPGLLSSVVHISLVGDDESTARGLLLNGLDAKRAKPAQRPTFPGAGAGRSHKAFPGVAGPSGVGPAPYVPNLKRSPTDADKRRFSRQAFEVIKDHFQRALDQLAQQDDAVECDFQPNTATEFMAEVFLRGKSACRCRIWLGGLHSSDGISYAEGQWHHGSNACNEILTVSDTQGELYITSLMGMGFGQLERQFDLKQMSREQAADYLWRRFVAPLER
ncbi:toll/interleukin-1 receptor domain-containing protein [Thiobacillus sedimenti]|uniref:Toll/interleukin-1 receptor domain-containing protein n=1 Tax=Thiobacillus sedimenti TaxID=3110231 RepID=A0ABZ1CFQ5_9PROT|nr:toll/interleukin-1 receptor domain-containing protein [Thiobacillus sp. SCUT-2]WRS38207.1 toll/interleukin-1 receptor domain-containing protein [Thiobacillus sp. SCUT-2]